MIQGGGGTAIQGGNGNVTLILQTGSQIVGTANGGAGTNTVTLQGTGTASNAFTNFQSLTMAGTDWTWAGTGTFSTALVQSGTLNLTGTLGTTTASVVATVNAGATLQANAANLPLSVTDNGLVRFQQDSAGTYTGTISGSGAVEKTGAGTLTVAPSAAGGNTYSGGTTITQGTLSIAADNALGASSGNLTLNGGTLQLGSSFNLASSRAVAITANNGTIDTQSFNSTIAQNISGAGSLTKLGSGTLTLNGTNGYTGGTNVNAGTLVVGDGSNSLAALAGGGLVTVASGATLGGYGSVTGDVTNNGTISVANALASLASGPTGNLLVKGTLTNAGLVQLGGSGVGNMLTVAGNYVGQNATIALNTTLAGDGAPSDKLIVSGGAASGTSTLKVTNVGGAGARTVTDGIQVVQAINGATTRAGAFSLSGGSVSAGAYTYFLAKGGEATGTGDSWYLRNTVPPKPQPPVVGPGQPTPPAEPPITPAEGTPESIVEAVDNAGTGGNPEPIYRPEVPLYAEAPAVARQLGLLQIDTFHDRQGEQGLLAENGSIPASWARVWGGHSDIKQKGDATRRTTARYGDAGRSGSVRGHHRERPSQPLRLLPRVLARGRRREGLRARAAGHGRRFAAGQRIQPRRLLDAHRPGRLVHRCGADGQRAHGSHAFDRQRQRLDERQRVHEPVEAGLPIALGYGLTLEPQAQLVWQWLSLDRFNDGISSVSWNNGNTFLGRIGARLQYAFDANGVSWKPYLRVNVLRAFGTDDKTTFGGSTTIGTQVGQTAGQIGAKPWRN